MTDSIEWPPSLWAAVTPAGPALGLAPDGLDADVIVIGAGFTGLSTALHLRRAGVDVAVIEAAEPGWGASGRNNGQVIPTLSRPDPDDIIRRHGAAGERLVALIRDSAETLFRIVREESIDAEAEQTGWIQPVHSPGRMKIAERRVEQWSRHGAPVELLDREAVERMTGSREWFGGFWNRTGGHINPLALARGLTRAVLARGGAIYARSPVRSVHHEGGRWRVEHAHGRATSRAIVLATNAYTGTFSRTLMPAIAREVVPVHSWQLATEPLGANIRARIIPGRQAVSDTHRELYFARLDARHRLVTGGAILLPVNRRERIQHHVGQRLARLFPDLAGVRFDYVWNGYVGMTRDFFPRMHWLGPDGFAWAGCNGRAVGLAMALGRELSEAVQGRPLDTLALPMSAPDPIPLHGAVQRFAPMALAYYRHLDRREI